MLNPVSYADTSTTNIAVDTLTQAVKQSSQLNDVEKNDLVLQLEQAAKWQASATKTREQTDKIQQELANTQNREAEIETFLQQSKQRLQAINNGDFNNQLSNQPSNQDIASLSQNLAQAQNSLAQANEQFLYWDSQLNAYQKLALDGVQQQQELEKSLAQLKPANKTSTELSLSEQVANVALDSRKHLLNNKLKQISLKLNRLDDLTRIAQLERDFWSQQKTIYANIVAKLQDLVLTKKTQLAETELKQVVDVNINQDSPLYSIQQMYIEVQKQKAQLTKQEKQIQAEITQAKTLINQAEADLARDQQIVELQSSPEIIARLFHKRLESITSIQVRESKIVELQNEINNAVLNQLLLSEKLRDMQTDSATSVLINDNQELGKTKLKQQYLTAAKDLQSFYPGFISKLSELNSLYIKQKQQYQEYQQFLNNHLLWLPNAASDSLTSFSALSDNLAAVFNGQNAKLLFNDFKTSISSHPLAALVSVLLIGALLYWRPKLKTKLKEYGDKTVSIRTDSFIYSLKAMLATLGLALPIPLVLYAFYSLLSNNPAAADITSQLATSLLNAAILILILSALRQSCRPKGLAEKHFHWNQNIIKTLYKEIQWVIPFAAVLILLVGLNADVMNSQNQQVVGRYAFILLMLGFMLLIYRLFGSNSVLMQEAKKLETPPSWLQMHLAWYSLLMLIPALIIWSTVSGYYYSAILIAEKLNLTIGLLLVSFILRELLLRSIYVNERQQQYQQRLKEHEAYLAQQNALPEEQREKGADKLPEVDENADINYQKLNNQVKQTINLTFFFAVAWGVWMLWADILLALDLVSNSSLALTKSEVIDGVVQEVPLTIGDLMQGLAIGFITLLLAKNLPGILEYTVLKFLPISPAARYAASSLIQYLIAIIGFVVIFRALGIEWSNIQWLVAALSVGLGFGLQEIVANFVSGIILLFEQPIRVNDVVTVGGTTGKVSKIRIRATTLVTLDRQELVIPNKDIITGNLINWTLSDPISRITVNVGVAYGSDVKKAMALMLEAAEEHPSILADPEPTVIFDNFGDNALGLTLRAFVDNMDNRVIFRSELHTLINDKMNDAGIVIAFPQRDVHIDTLSPLEIQISRAPKTSKPEENKEKK